MEQMTKLETELKIALEELKDFKRLHEQIPELDYLKLRLKNDKNIEISKFNFEYEISIKI